MKKYLTLILIMLLMLLSSVPVAASEEGYCGFKDVGDADLSGFTDADEISDWAKDAVGWAVETGLLHGNGSQLQPLGIATRAEAAQILMNKQAEGALPAPFTVLQDYLTWADEIGYPEGLLDPLGAAGINQDYFHTPAGSDAYTSGRIVIGDSRCCQLGIYEQRAELSDFAVYAVWGGHYAPDLTPVLLREDLLADVQDCFEAQIRACGKCTIYFFATVNDNEYENNENEERIAAALQAAEGFASMSVKVNGKMYHPDMVLIGFDGGSVSTPILGRIEPASYNRYVPAFNETFLSRAAESEVLAPFSSGFTTVPEITEGKTAFNADALHYSDGILAEIISFITGD